MAGRFDGKTFRDLRRMKGLTQKRLGLLCDGSDQRTILRWENGTTRRPDGYLVAKAAHVIGVEAITFYEETEDDLFEDQEEAVA